MKNIPKVLCFFLALAIGCTGDHHLVLRLDRLEQRLEHVQKEISLLRNEVADGFSIALCTPELRQLIEDVRKECTKLSSLEGSCSTPQIRPAVIAVDPEHQGRFLKLMGHIRHEVLYIHEKSTDLVPERRERLSRLASQALLRNTQFLVVTSPEGGGQIEALRRANIVEQFLIKNGVPRTKILRWLYAFPAERRDIQRMTDLPTIGEVSQLNRSIWVFRADC